MPSVSRRQGHPGGMCQASYGQSQDTLAGKMPSPKGARSGRVQRESNPACIWWKLFELHAHLLFTGSESV